MTSEASDLNKELESIKNLLIISLLKSGVKAEAIENATGINAKTIKNRFPKKLIEGKE